MTMKWETKGEFCNFVEELTADIKKNIDEIEMKSIVQAAYVLGLLKVKDYMKALAFIKEHYPDANRANGRHNLPREDSK